MNRREVLSGGLTLAALAASGSTQAQTNNLIGITWGGPQLDASRPIASAWQRSHPGTRVAWEVHTGSSSAVATKIRATWPNVNLHFCHVNDPAIHIMNREGWLETVDDLPNLKHVPDKFILKNASGNAIAVPHCASAVCWGYRTDLVETPINALSDLLEPRFKGRIGFRDPNSWSGLPLVSIALDGGGDERNIDPAFDFLSKVAKAGNIVNVGKSNADVINSLNLGESSVAIAGATEWAEVAKNHPIKLLNRVEGSKGLRSFYALVHWAIPKSSLSGPAKDLGNFFLEEANNTAYCKTNGVAPANKNSSFANPLGILLSGDELERFGYFCDFDLMGRQEHKWTERFDTEIRPLLRRS
jgi:putative spermidine/putrescine transport system substrate-binding protein